MFQRLASRLHSTSWTWSHPETVDTWARVKCYKHYWCILSRWYSSMQKSLFSGRSSSFDQHSSDVKARVCRSEAFIYFFPWMKIMANCFSNNIFNNVPHIWCFSFWIFEFKLFPTFHWQHQHWRLVGSAGGHEPPPPSPLNKPNLFLYTVFGIFWPNT